MKVVPDSGDRGIKVALDRSRCARNKALAGMIIAIAGTAAFLLLAPGALRVTALACAYLTLHCANLWHAHNIDVQNAQAQLDHVNRLRAVCVSRRIK